ncbi:hypothetical protein K3G69_26870 [Phytobacter diazotrophicus]|uniref:hypothetical protein n=1 Tax=Phytobacter diazotrophicus TaxID=395631 RepID=UPI001C995307|nr:hypothetical protein [Phytobacter diazotrophicus]MBY6260102.1 hypothetical protein [Phytobacter diazotrophicus]
MPSENTYSAFKSNDFIVVLHQQGHDIPQALAIFREPRNLISHEKKLIGTYSYSNEAITLIDDPQHDGRDVLNAISLHLRKQRNSVATRGLKYLASAVAGALITSAIWYHATPGDLYGNLPEKGATSFSIPTVGSPETLLAPDRKLNQALATAIAAAPTNPALQPTTNETLRHAAVTESQNMQNVMRDNRNALPTSPAAALQPSTPPVPPVASSSAQVAPIIHTAPQIATQTTARLQMADVLKRNAARGMFTITLSSGHERTLFAFLDPTCSACRLAEPAIERLAQEYNVIVFPVSVVNDGGDAVNKIVPLLCQKDPARRASGWLDLFRADAGMVTPGNENNAPVNPECEKAAAAAVAVNDLGFRQFGFEGTPWVLTDTGFHLSSGLLAEPAKIDLFLKTTDPMPPEQADRFLQTVNAQE